MIYLVGAPGSGKSIIIKILSKYGAEKFVTEKRSYSFTPPTKEDTVFTLLNYNKNLEQGYKVFLSVANILKLSHNVNSFQDFTEEWGEAFEKIYGK